MEPSEHEKERIERLRRAMYSRSLSGMLHERPRRSLSEEQQVVGEDWQRTEPKVGGVTVAPRYMGTARAILWWLLVGSVVFFLASVLFFAYYFTFGPGSIPASPGNIDISVTGPPTVSGGEPVELQIAVANRNKVPLELTELVITYPQGTRSPADFATDLPSQRIALGTIEPGGRRQGTVSAVFAGTEGQHAPVKVELEYRVAGSNSVFVASSVYDLAFSTSPLSISIDGNTQTISGQPVLFTVNVTSNANAPIRDAILTMDVPFGFKLTSTEPKATAGNLWALGDMAPGDRRSITVSGTLSGEPGDRRVFRFAAGTRTSPEKTAIETKLAANTFDMQVAQTFLGLTIAVNKESGANVIVGPGENTAVTISYQNNLSVPITDAIIVARLGGLRIDGAEVSTNDGFYRSNDETVLWDKTTTGGALATIAPGERGTVSFSFKMPTSEELGDATDPRLEISVNAAGKRLSESGVPQNLQSVVRQTVKLATNLQLAGHGLYYSNPFGSSGPMPPKAGSETTYALVFTVTNTTNRITNAKMTAQLPPYVRWVGIYSPSSEKLSFNQLDGTVTWEIGTIESGVGIGGTSPRQAAIAIGFTPSTSQIGQTPSLLRNLKLTGTDAATGATITRTANDITTNIAGDPGFSPAQATVVR